MAAAKDNVMSLGHLSGRDIHTSNGFSNPSEQSLKKRSFLLQDDISTRRHQHNTGMHLQQVWQELKDREWAARCRNQQLLLQFERSQDTLREMLARTVTMKTIRIEYERYLEDNSPRWQQQLKEKTQSAQKKRMEECLKVCLKSTVKQLPTSASQGPSEAPKVAAPPVNSSHDDPYPPDLPPSWLTQFQNRMPCQPKGPAQILPSSTLQLQQLWWPNQNPASWAPSEPDNPYSWTFGAAGIPSGSEALFEGTPAPEATEETEGNRGSSSKSHSSQTLDTEPVRLLRTEAERSVSGRFSSKRRRENRKKRERAQRTCSDREECRAQTLSTPTSAIATVSSRRMKTRSSGLVVESPVIEGTAQKRTRSEGNDSGSEDQPTSEDSGSLESEESTSETAARPVRESEHCREGSVRKLMENRAEDGSTSDQSSTAENIVRHKEPKTELEDDEEKDREEDVKKSTTEEEDQDDEMEAETDEDKGDDEEQSDRQKTEVSGNTSSQDEGTESSDDDDDDDDGGSDGEANEGGEFDEQICDKVEEPERDPDSSIISPQNRRKRIQVIPEDISEDDGKDGSRAEDSVEESNEFEDDEIEHLLAPQEPTTQKKEKEQKTDEKPTALCSNVKIFQVELNKSGSGDHESDEFDHFYD